jgi:molybdopterin-containing oxidoreductase family iron-sulfur binding subunit
LRELASAERPSAPTQPGELSRRDLLAGIGVSVAAASALLSGCSRAPSEKIVPYRVQPEDVVPGRAAHYATAMTLDGYATGLLVEAHEGRPTKIEGNPDHPASLGASGIFEQAALLELYGPHRQTALRHRGAPQATPALTRAVKAALDPADRGRGVHLVLPPTSSSVTARLLERLRDDLPELNLHFHSALRRSQAFRGTQLAFAQALEARPDLRRANVVLALDADFLMQPPCELQFARAFALRRRVRATRDSMNRLYVAEPSLTVTGQMADHRFALRDSELPTLCALLLSRVARELGQQPAALEAVSPELTQLGSTTPALSRFVDALARDLLAQQGAAAVLVGARQHPSVQAAAHALNHLLDPAGNVVSYGGSPLFLAGGTEHDSLPLLSSALDARAVNAVFVLEANIAYATPGTLKLGERLANAKSSFYLALHADETSSKCEWLIPAAHFLESWDDAKALDGTASVVQPLLSPLYGGRTHAEFLSLLLGDELHAHELTRASFQEHGDDDAAWEVALSRGVIGGSETPRVSPRLRWDFLPELLQLTRQPPPQLELSLGPDARILDGRFGDNPWLYELPDAVTKLTWSNAALLGPHTANRLGLTTGDLAWLSVGARRVEAPVIVVPGQAEHSVSLSLGWGRSAPGGPPIGVDAFSLATGEQRAGEPASLTPSGRRAELAITQSHASMEGFDDSIIAHSSLLDYRASPERSAEQRKRQLSLYTARLPKASRQWGMAIDLNACTGCGACIIACQAENNVPTVGQSGVLKHREMQWIRVDRYVARNGTTLLQPMACQHCEHAPCEYVCPTGATLHSSDGLNQMVYNRCVGTRFCSNNCPYKVRRFNWFDYHARETSTKTLVYNPNVTVRERGVMEKCSYCVQRIRGAEIRAQREARELKDGDVVTACEQACPSAAIVFGDVADPASRVSALHANERAFEVLNELGTAPRTRYLAKLTNPNPELG